MIRFLLNDDEIALEEINPNISLLEYLREEVYLTGTKEGCASGDCGACTVVTSKLDDDNASLQYESINACIVPLGSLHGRQIITVEHLQHLESLHNCQRAMAVNHGSQCGFCTPGFVMSLFSYLKNMHCRSETLHDQLSHPINPLTFRS
jgi:xanthine dehydrogenase small subunit